MYFFQINVLTILLCGDLYLYVKLRRYFTQDLTVKLHQPAGKLHVLQLLLVPIGTKVDTINAWKIKNPDNPNSLQAIGPVFNKQIKFKYVLLCCSCIFMFNP